MNTGNNTAVVHDLLAQTYLNNERSRSNSIAEGSHTIFVMGHSRTVTTQMKRFSSDTKKELVTRRISKEGFLLTAMMQEEIYESGVSNPSEEYFSDLLRKDRLGALNCINEIFWTHFHAHDKKMVNVLIGILHMISHLEYEDVLPTGQTLAALALNHKNIEVCEYAVKCFENWAHKDCVDKLRAMSISSRWLEKYVNDVIAELEG